MNLLNNDIDETANLLPFDGTVHYYGKLLSNSEADHYLNGLLETIAWKHDEAVMFGKHIITKRKVAWYGDEAFSYTYSKKTKQALPWTDELKTLKDLVEQKTETNFNSCLLNLYHNGDEGMSWHSDDEKELMENSAIASLSLGAERKFSFRHKQSKETVALMLEHGSLLVMKDTTQTHWHHQLPKTKKVTMPRVNLTFRRMVE
ncbi:alpha-ketoglutarate-dependent dioxygenase AlkB family protein [Tunicatimonas pelagia]|uniref:alpha-ketoglutarate-dependent dioxygenase AlkB family protein n=1 Tax=Tunicatimonas pelagia TaxID=931531 RepID=UPI002666B228|nr:alpha-ketoglutarate-dependent dioxygenase AlkB [Tunicatimonas pelagia]WKN41276.1 alpha-ketoglutarate-dependent dioxygenase AlkB [Tunicatimonas pelagia]